MDRKEIHQVIISVKTQAYVGDSVGYIFSLEGRLGQIYSEKLSNLKILYAIHHNSFGDYEWEAFWRVFNNYSGNTS